ncbi:MAG TPA: hypothetical protein VF100_09170 [Thermoanaerobaculia bacterium]
MADAPRSATPAAALQPPEDRPLAAEELRELRRFHRHGGPPEEVAGKAGAAAWLPPALAAFRGQPVRGDYPLFLAAGDEGEVICRPLPALLAELAPGEPRSLADNLVRLERAVRERVTAAGARGPAAVNGGDPSTRADLPPIPASPVLAEAAAAVLSEIRLPAGEADAFVAGLTALREALPPDGVFVPFDAGAPLALLGAAVVGRREAARAAVLAEARALAANAADLLAIDRAAANGRRGPALETSLGALGGRFLSADALAEVGEARRGGTALAAERLAGLAAARDTLDAFCAAPPAPRLFVAAAPRQPVAGAWRIETAADPAAAAAAAWDEEADRALALVRALHRVRLEVARDFDPERHEAWLEHLAWEDLGADELALAAPVAAVVAPADLLAGGLPSLSRLLLSGRPVQVVVAVDPARLDDPEGRTGFRFEPAFLGVAHREVFVQQGSVARPEALLDGFRRALAGPRPGLHVVAAPPSPASGRSAGLDPWLLASAAVEGRAHPLFAYDPGAGLSWARRLDFRANPEPEADWVTHELPLAGDGDGLPRALPFTAADMLLLADPAAARPAPGAADELVPLADWLALDPAEASRRLPFVWAADRRGRLARLVVTRRLALAARDRLAFWHLLQELGGVRNEHVEEARRAAAAAAAETAAAERQELAGEHAAELERVRREAAAEAVDRLVAALFELDPRELAAAPGVPLAGLALPADVDRLAAALLDAARGPADGAPADPASTAPEDPQVTALAGELLAVVHELESEDVPTRGAAR